MIISIVMMKNQSDRQGIKTTLYGAQFFNCTIKRKDQIRTLSCLQDSVKIGDDIVHVKPEVLFNELTLLVQKENERLNTLSTN